MEIPVIDSKIVEKQKEYLLEQARIRLTDAATQEEVSQLADEVFYRYQMSLGKPLFQAREVVYGELPFLETYYENNKEIEKDLDILFSELNTIAIYLVDYFNYSQSERDRIINLINGITGTVNDLHLLTEENTPNTIFFKESFSNHDGFDSSLTDEENRAMIHTKEGVLTLKRTNAMNRSLESKIRTINGNGMSGTYYLARKIQADSDFDNYEYVSKQLKNDEGESIIDGNPDTVFEYQIVNVPESEKKKRQNIDMEWGKGKEHGEILRVKVIVQLKEPQEINWINLNPYHAPNSPGSFNVYSIRTSVDAINYVGLFEDEGLILNQEINETPQSYRAEDIFDGSDDFANTKFTGQGVWSFPTRKVKQVEFVLEQRNSYRERLGQEEFYERVIKRDDTPGAWKRIPRQRVPSHIVDDKYGITRVSSDYEIKKELSAIMGWRYAIGIRDIQLMSFEFGTTSEFISKPYKVEDGIEHLLFYCNEKIPKAYKEKVQESNDWIKYYVSFDDVDWHRISPQHHQPTTDDFPAKILSINDNTTSMDNHFKLFKNNLEMEENPTQFRIKIVLKRPEQEEDGRDLLSNTTPFVEDYAVKIITKQREV